MYMYIIVSCNPTCMQYIFVQRSTNLKFQIVGYISVKIFDIIFFQTIALT